MITYLLVIGAVAGFLLGVCVTTLCMSAREGDRGMVDLSGAAARGDLSFMDKVGRTAADDPRGGRTW